MPAWNTVIGDAVAICAEELGLARAGIVVAQAGVRTAVEEGPLLVSGTLRGTPERSAAEDAASYALWGELWRGLAEERPSAFELPLRKLAGQPSPTTLAYLYARKRALMRPFKPRPAERRLIGQGTELLHRWTGVAAFGEPNEVQVFGRQCKPLRGLRESLGWVGASLIDEPLLRRHIVLDGGYLADVRALDHGEREVAALVLHEDVHGAISAEFDVDAPRQAALLARAVNEASVSFLEQTAVMAASGMPHLPADVVAHAHTISHGYGLELAALVGCLPDGLSADAAARCAVSLLRELLPDGSDAAAAEALNRLAGRRRTLNGWRRLFACV